MPRLHPWCVSWGARAPLPEPGHWVSVPKCTVHARTVLRHSGAERKCLLVTMTLEGITVLQLRAGAIGWASVRRLPNCPWGEVGRAGGISEAVAGQVQGDNLAPHRLHR